MYRVASDILHETPHTCYASASSRPGRRSLLIPSRLVNRTASPLIPVRRVPRVTVQITLGDPFTALPRPKLPLAVHDIDLLEGQRLGFVEEEVHNDRGRGIGAEEDETESVADPRVGEGGQERNHEVSKPIAGSSEACLPSPRAQRERLTYHYPGERAPDVAL